MTQADEPRDGGGEEQLAGLSEFARDVARSAYKFLSHLWIDEERLAEFEAEVVLFTLPEKEARGYNHLWRAAAGAAALCERGSDVYLSVAAMRLGTARMIREGTWHRGREADAAALPAVVADFDLATPDRKKPNLFTSRAEIEAVLGTLPLLPSEVVDSGGGVQPWWRFKEPMDLRTDLGREEARRVTQGWQRAVRSAASKAGRTIDSVHDLARVLRMPGTLNRKRPGEPAKVAVKRRTAMAEYLPEDILRVSPPPDQELLDRAAALPGSTVVGSLVLNPQAEPPASKFEALSINVPRFKAVWDHKDKSRGGDESLSSFDMRLANIACESGWEDQEIANLLVAHRLKYAGDLKLRDRYYRDTIDKARRRAAASVAQSEIVAAGVEAGDPSGREKVLAAFAEITGGSVARIITYAPERILTTLIFIDGREIHTNLDDLTDWKKFWSVLLRNRFNPSTERPKPAVWLALVRGLYAVAEDIFVESSGPAGVVAQLCAQLASETHVDWRHGIETKEDDRALALRSDGSFFWDHNLWVRVPGLKRIAVDQKADEKYRQPSFLKAILTREMGAEERRMNARLPMSVRTRKVGSATPTDAPGQRDQACSTVYGVTRATMMRGVDAQENEPTEEQRNAAGLAQKEGA